MSAAEISRRAFVGAVAATVPGALLAGAAIAPVVPRITSGTHDTDGVRHASCSIPLEDGTTAELTIEQTDDGRRAFIGFPGDGLGLRLTDAELGQVLAALAALRVRAHAEGLLVAARTIA